MSRRLGGPDQCEETILHACFELIMKGSNNISETCFRLLLYILNMGLNTRYNLVKIRFYNTRSNEGHTRYQQMRPLKIFANLKVCIPYKTMQRSYPTIGLINMIIACLRILIYILNHMYMCECSQSQNRNFLMKPAPAPALLSITKAHTVLNEHERHTPLSNRIPWRTL